MPRRFLTPPIELLTAEGAFVPLAPGSGPWAGWRRPIVLIARELCHYAWFEPAAKGGAAGQAARLYARAHAPYLNPGSLLRRVGGGYGVWWWDEDTVGPYLADRFGDARPQAAPETLAQPAGGAWRIVRLANGFELQAWRGRALAASSWRRVQPSAADWAAFTRLQRDPPVPPPTAPPTPETLPLAEQLNLAPSALELTPASAARLAAGVAAALLAVLAAFWTGQGLRLGGLADRLERQAHALQQVSAPTRGADADSLRRIAAFRALAARPDAVAGLETALRVVRAKGVTAKSFAIDGAVVSVTVPYAALDKVQAITQDLEATGAYAEVRPLTDSSDAAIRLEMTLTGAPPANATAG
ncbi:MAG TPA: hypothetical protein VN694_04700 [Caulobacteraceae bacterium]|nr:hypothetical protein [Caulobacteraceae bacterium]